MNRTFHVKISGTTHLFLILFTLIMLVAFWYKGAALIGMFFAMIVIINIERIIHSTYTLTADGNLVIYNGRFQEEKKHSAFTDYGCRTETSLRIETPEIHPICIGAL